MNYFFIVGERSGDQHAASVISRLIEKDNQAQVYAWGGESMEAAGATLLRHYKHYSFMGFWEVFTRIFQFRKLFAACKKDLIRIKPDVLVLVDFAGFNLRIAAVAHKAGIKTCYYISPKVWVWNTARVRQIKAHIDRMLVILPFEKAFYKDHGLEVEYVGNPTLEHIQNYQFDSDLLAQLAHERRIITVLPGSRKQEIQHGVEVLTKLAGIYEDYLFLVAGVDNADTKWYEPLDEINNIRLCFGKTYELLKIAKVAIVTSGTATLETALLGIPQVVVYKTSWFSYWIAKMVIKVRYISLVNLIAEKCVVHELIQGDYNAIDLSAQLESLLNEPTAKKRISKGYSEIQNKIGSKSASQAAAEAIHQLSKGSLCRS